jgi:hypothetical protein
MFGVRGRRHAASYSKEVLKADLRYSDLRHPRTKGKKRKRRCMTHLVKLCHELVSGSYGRKMKMATSAPKGAFVRPVRLAGGWWLMLICSEIKVLLAGCWWLIYSERKVLLAGG